MKFERFRLCNLERNLLQRNDKGNLMCKVCRGTVNKVIRTLNVRRYLKNRRVSRQIFYIYKKTHTKTVVNNVNLGG